MIRTEFEMMLHAALAVDAKIDAFQKPNNTINTSDNFLFWILRQFLMALLTMAQCFKIKCNKEGFEFATAQTFASP